MSDEFELIFTGGKEYDSYTWCETIEEAIQIVSTENRDGNVTVKMGDCEMITNPKDWHELLKADSVGELEAFLAYHKLTGNRIYAKFQNKYTGAWGADRAAFAMNEVDYTEVTWPYIDWERLGDALMVDYQECNGYYFRR